MAPIYVKNAAELAEYILLAREQDRSITVYLSPTQRVAIQACGRTSQQSEARFTGRWYIDAGAKWPLITEAQKLVAETEEK